MKPLLYTPLFILFFLVLPTEVISQNTSEQITGTWTLDYDTTLKGIDSDAKVAFNNVPQAHRMGIEKAYKDRQMIFNSDNTFKLKLTDGRSSEGTWVLNPSEEVLKIKNEVANRVYPYKVHVITKEKLVIEELEAKGKGYFKKMHFIKLNK